MLQTNKWTDISNTKLTNHSLRQLYSRVLLDWFKMNKLFMSNPSLFSMLTRDTISQDCHSITFKCTWTFNCSKAKLQLCKHATSPHEYLHYLFYYIWFIRMWRGIGGMSIKWLRRDQSKSYQMCTALPSVWCFIFMAA